MICFNRVIGATSDMRTKIKRNKKFVSSLAVTISVILVISIISMSIAGVSSRKTNAELIPGSGVTFDDVTRIEAPSLDTDSIVPDADTYSDTDAQSSESSDETIIRNDCLELVLPAVTTSTPNVSVENEQNSILTVPETSAQAVETSSLPESTAQPETTQVPETTFIPETTATPETTETNVPVATAQTDNGFLVDKYNIEYDLITPTVAVSDEEIKLTAAIIQLEVMGDGSELESFDDTTLKYWEMLAVAMCIRNRAESSHFPDTVKEVILDSVTINGKTYYQFSPATVLDSCTPTDEALSAAREVLCEGVTVLADNYYYFCASSIENRFEKNNSYSLIETDSGYAKVRGDTTTFYAGFYNE